MALRSTFASTVRAVRGARALCLSAEVDTVAGRTPAPIEEVQAIEADTFAQSYVAAGRPLVLRGACSSWRTPQHLRHTLHCTGLVASWPALREWATLEALQARAGPADVPLECGQHFLDPASSLKTFDFQYYLAYLQHYREAVGQLGNMYLAQHALFETLPHLAGDAPDPPLRKAASAADEVPVVNAWIGPPGQTSPLHWDDSDNLLCQVVAEKAVLLFPPEDSAALHPLRDPQRNVSAVGDPRGPAAAAAWPSLAATSPCVATLAPGDALFLPRQWWHHCTASPACSFSASVNFWWRSGRPTAAHDG